MRSFLLGEKTEVKPALPYDAEVEYLESTGTQFVDTGVPENLMNRFYAKFKFTDTTQDWAHIFGCRQYFNFTIRRAGAGTTSSLSFYVQNNEVARPSALSPDYATEAWIENGTILTLTNGAQTTSGIASHTPLGNTESTFWMFRGYNGYVKARIYACSSDVFDLIPVRKDGVGMFYDRVSGEFFGNSGTGDFIIGPDKEVA